MRVLIAALQQLRDRLHARAYEQHAQGRAEAAHALWSVVEELDHLITQLGRKASE